MNPYVRQATKADLPALRGFQQQIVLVERQFDEDIPQGEVCYYDIADLLDDSNARVVLAEIDEVPVGCGLAWIKDNDSWALEKKFGYLGLMYVEEQYRRKGIAKLIVDTLVTWLREQGMKHIVLETYTDNKIALEAYRKMGFEDFTVQMKFKA